jgi:hypothetical protein
MSSDDKKVPGHPKFMYGQQSHGRDCMKSYLITVATTLAFLVGTTAFSAQHKTHLRKYSLTDHQLDSVTAGTADTSSAASGGVIVADDSTATITRKGTLSLDGGAQEQTKALNLVNSVDSGVANGVNVWDGKITNSTGVAPTQLTVNQKNNVSQTEGVTASLPSYVRPTANETLTSQGSSQSQSSSTSSSTADFKNIQQTSLTRDLTSSGSVDTQTTILGQDIKAGKGIAGSGDINVNFDAGQVNFSATASAGQILSGAINLGVQLPQFQVKFDGSICAVMEGSCQSQGTLNETRTTLNNQSHSTSESSSMTSMEAKTWDIARNIQAPITITGAKADYIVADNSKLNATNDYSVSLDGTTQQNAEALNLVNAAGSMVTNAVNVSRTPTVGPAINLNQINIVNQRM